MERRLRPKQLTVGGFVGHPDSFKWYKEPEAKYLGPAPQVPKSGSRIMIEAKKIPQFDAAGDHVPLRQDGPIRQRLRLRPLRRQVRPVRKATLRRRPDAQHRHARHAGKGERPLSGRLLSVPAGFGSGNVPVRFGKDGSLFVGGTNRGWGSRGNKPFAIERLVWTGKMPFEIHEMKAKPDGFELTFTKPVDPEEAGKAESYDLKTFTYIYQASYGSPEVDQTTCKIKKIEVAKDKKSVRLYVDGLVEGHIHELHAPGVRSADGLPLLHPQAYYTLNIIPGK